MSQKQSPVIGITADFTAAKKKPKREARLFLAERYYRAIELAGATPIVLPTLGAAPSIRQSIDLIDGLVISGGGFDIHPSYYGEKPIKQLGVIKAERTEFELDLTATALKRDKPLLGLCGGEQALNVVLGGTLYQDIAAQLPNADEHEQSAKKSSGGHFVQLLAGTKLQRIIRRQRIEVNTTHHQAVRKLGRHLIVNAIAEDGVIEGIESTHHRFAIGVQWHPEVLAPKRLAHRRIIEAFIAACRQR